MLPAKVTPSRKPGQI
ncbi:hypothetical protein E1H13_25880 [Nodosilinea sp. P-1105]|nr:hypothetical protein [Nodosilinea sp. P-1105]